MLRLDILDRDSEGLIEKLEVKCEQPEACSSTKIAGGDVRHRRPRARTRNVIRSPDHASSSTTSMGKLEETLANAGLIRRKASSLPSLWGILTMRADKVIE
jgi:hypothetical protein